MKTTLQVEIKEFATPNFVTVVREPGERQEGFQPQEGIPLKEVDAKTLGRLCDNYRREVFNKAQKQDPHDIAMPAFTRHDLERAFTTIDSEFANKGHVLVPARSPVGEPWFNRFCEVLGL